MRDVSFVANERLSWWLRLPIVREVVLCTALAGTTASLLVWLAPPGVDTAAHRYQRFLFLTHGLTLWDNFWYAGRYAFVDYSLLYYPLAAPLGIGLLAVLTVAVAAAGFAVLLDREWGAVGRWPSRAFAVVWAGIVLTGEFPFALGVALALLALLAFRLQRRWLGSILTLLVLAASPVALVLLGVVLVGVAVARRAPLRGNVVPALALGAAATTEIVLLRLFPFGGSLSFPSSSAAAALAFCAIGYGCTRSLERARVLSSVFAAYAIVVVIAYLVPTGLGANISRLRFLALPLALLVLALRRWRPIKVSILVAALALSWNVAPLATGWASGAQDVSSQASVWRTPISYLHAHLRPGYRVEAVDTANHWPAYYLASARIPLARGWFRQDDYPFDALLYRARPLTRAAYLAWLHSLGVEYVVLTHSPPDYSSQREARLVRSGHAGLHRVFATPEIDIYEVPATQSIVTGPGRPRVLAFRESRLVLRVSRGGTYRVAVRWSPYWRASAGCITRMPGGLIRLRTPAAATVRIAFDVDASSMFDALADETPRCRPGSG